MRLDQYIKQHYNLSREKSIDLIKLGNAFVNNKLIIKPAYKVLKDDIITINNIFKFVSRAGLKLEDAIKYFNLNFKDKVVIDVGSSTGGFTDCSLFYGAKKVYAYDVGKDQMNEALKLNPKIELHEKTNILDVNLNEADICLVDVSFTSVKPIIKHIKDKCDLLVVLFKPQFEAGKKHINGGIVKNKLVVDNLIEDFKLFFKNENINLIGYKPTTLKGKKGNQEYIFIGEQNVK